MLKVGILGGGQLGRMLLQAAANYPVETYVLENEDDCPAAHLCHLFSRGDIRSYEDVYAFGSGLDAITIEIENVNTDALEQLEKEGISIFPKPSVLKTIRNKVLQKEYYQAHDIPTAGFIITRNKKEVLAQEKFLPAIHKLGQGGYDGRGVKVLKDKDSLSEAFDEEAVLEKKINIKKEIALIVAVNNQGETAIYPPVEMVFDPVLNLLDFQVSPAELDQKTLWKAEAIALSTVRNFKSAGIYAIEMFIDDNNNVLVNETAPRVHNSGHHTIEAHYCSQFDMLWRIILGYPLGNTDPILPSIMVNIIGGEGQTGEVKYNGLEEVLKIENAFVHIYGKKITKPGRKMGHVTVLSKDRQELLHQSNKIRRLLIPGA